MVEYVVEVHEATYAPSSHLVEIIIQNPKLSIQSGLEFGTFEFRIHSKTECFKVPFSNIRSEKLQLA